MEKTAFDYYFDDVKKKLSKNGVEFSTDEQYFEEYEIHSQFEGLSEKKKAKYAKLAAFGPDASPVKKPKKSKKSKKKHAEKSGKVTESSNPNTDATSCTAEDSNTNATLTDHGGTDTPDSRSHVTQSEVNDLFKSMRDKHQQEKLDFEENIDYHMKKMHLKAENPELNNNLGVKELSKLALMKDKTFSQEIGYEGAVERKIQPVELETSNSKPRRRRPLTLVKKQPPKPKQPSPTNSSDTEVEEKSKNEAETPNLELSKEEPVSDFQSEKSSEKALPSSHNLSSNLNLNTSLSKSSLRQETDSLKTASIASSKKIGKTPKNGRKVHPHQGC